MSHSRTLSFQLFLVIELACFSLLSAGVLTMCSPLWISGGLVGWWEGYDSQRDVLGIVWLGGSMLSFLLGLAICGAAAIGGIAAGIAAGVIGVARRSRERSGPEAPNQSGQ